LVFGNLSTGYWLGAAAAAGLHWIELGRKTLTGTSDTIDVTGVDLTTVTYGGSDITTDLTWTQTIGSSTSDTFYILKDTSADVMDIKAAGNCGTDGSPSIAYATLPTALSTAGWTMRFKLVFNTVTAESTGGKSFFTNFFIVDSGTSSSGVGSENGFGFKFIADAGSTQSQFYSTTSGTDSGTTMNWTPSSSSTIYAEISYSGGTATANFYSDSGYSSRVSSTTANATRSGTFSGLKFPQIALRQDTGGNGVMEIDMSELKIYNGGLTAKPYMMVLGHQFGADTHVRYRFNNDTGSNYARRYSANGGSDSTNVNQDNFPTNYDMNPCFNILNIMNIADQEKLIEGGTCELNQTTGAGTAPNRMELTGKWTNTSNAINQVNCYQTGSGDFAVGSEVVVLGYDPDDTEGTSVWEELTSKVITSNTASPVTTDTFTAKKYLWIQLEIRASTSPEFRVGTGGSIDTGSNYALRTASNGGTDETKINQVHLNTPTDKGFINMFVINKSDKEKLFIYELIDQNTAGAGNAPNRREYVGKWINTSGQIDVVQLYKSGATFNADTRIKVWGFD